MGGNSQALVWPGGRRKGATSPDRAFIEVGKKFRTDHAAKGEKEREREAGQRDADGQCSFVNRPGQQNAIPFGDPVQHWILPLMRAPAEEDTGQDRGDDDGKDHRARAEQNQPSTPSA